MRRYALLGFALLLPGCQFAGNPLDGFGTFIADTHTFHENPNAPIAHSENEQRVEGQEPATATLLPEPGNVWPGPPAPIPTLQDVQKLNNNEALPPPNLTTSPPPAVFPQNSPPPAGPPISSPSIQRPPGPVATPQGAALPYNGGNGITTVPVPGGNVTVIPNGNGTNTVIGPDGSIQSMPKSP